MNARTVTASCDEVEFLQPEAEDAPYRLERVVLDWSSLDPHAVQVTFHNGVVWMLSRHMVAEGLLGPVGVGDVFLSPDPFDHWSLLLVLSYRFRVGFRMPAEFVSDFLADVERASSGLVPVVLNWDSVVAQWAGTS